MKSHLSVKDNKRRQLFLKLEWQKLQLRAIADNMSLPFEVRYKARLELTDFSRDSSITRIRNRCVLTGRSRGVYRFFKISRIKIRELMSHNKLPGLKKSSW